MSIRYIGSKARMTEAILSVIGKPDGGRFIDAFCGMGSVASRAADCGWAVMLNDALLSATLMARARLLSFGEVPFRGVGGYHVALAHLNQLPVLEGGYIWRTYSPASVRFDGQERRYFTEQNASKIDVIRKQISTWAADGQITIIERDLLLANLIQAANAVANTAGTYGCFLRTWQPGSLKQLAVVPRELRVRPVDQKWSIGLASDLRGSPQDTAYLDPPYTKRQYASYYHILETIAHGDEPEVEGVSGLRPWRHASSDFCYKRRALGALRESVENIGCRRVFVSYSDEGHMDFEDMQSELGMFGSVKTHEIDLVGRYRPNRTASAARAQTREVLVELQRETVQ